jgi:hypothetical protein
MISKEERQHILKIKEWSIESRKALLEAMSGKLGELLRKVNKVSGAEPSVVFDNIDWLIKIIERESHTAGVKGILKAVEEHSSVGLRDK